MFLYFQNNHEDVWSAKFASKPVAQPAAHPSANTAIPQEQTPDPSHPTQQKMDDHLAKKKYTPSHPKQKSLIHALLHMITFGLLPLSIVENEGFREFCQLADPQFQMPIICNLQIIGVREGIGVV